MSNSPYRDENASLRSEVERLRAQVRSRPRRSRLWIGLGLVLLDFGATMMLRPWLNGDEDTKFWAAVAGIVALAAAATWSVARP